VCLRDLAGIGVNDVRRISGPVHLNLISRLPGDVHGSPPALLVLLDVIAELGVHQGLTAALAAGLQILRPQQLFVDAVPLELPADIIEVRHLPGGADLRGLGEQRLLQNGIRHGVIQRPRNPVLTGCFQDLINGLLGSTAAGCDVHLTEIHTVQSQNLSILGHIQTSHNVFAQSA